MPAEQPGQPDSAGPPPPAAEPHYASAPPPVRPAAVRRSRQYGQPAVRPAASTASRVRPAAYGRRTAQPPPNYLVWAILSDRALLPACSASPSIVFAAQVNAKYAAGDLAGAQESSRKAQEVRDLVRRCRRSSSASLYVVFVVLVAARLGQLDQP